MWKNVFAGLAASLVLTAAGATVESVFARQMWPWQTHFEVSYVLRTALSEAVDVSLKVSAGGDEYIIPAAELLGETAGLTAGEYKLVWDSTVSSAPTAAWLKAHSGRLAFNVVTAPSASAAEYLVIDLSGGPDAASWPSERITGKPYGGWTTEHKTTKLVLRRIYAGGSGNVFSSEKGVTFKFGCDSGTDQAYKCSDDFDAVDATLTNDYWIGVFELTQKQYQLITGDSVSSAAFTTGDAYPQTKIGYYTHMRGETVGCLWPRSSDVDADSLMGILRAKVALPRAIPPEWKFDLPTEAQWEYACRAGTTGPWNNGGTYDVYIYDETESLEGDRNLDLVGWNPANCNTGGKPVGEKLANAWGLYDMHGNAAEYCIDYNYAGVTQKGRSGFEPMGYAPSSATTTSSARVVKGGGYSIYWTTVTSHRYWKGHRSCGHVRTYNGNASDYITCRVALRNSAVNAGH